MPTDTPNTCAEQKPVLSQSKGSIQQTSANDSNMTFDQLADRIVLVDENLRQQAAHAVNCMLTARN